MHRPNARPAGHQLLLTQLENYRATRDRCREPQRSIFTALIQQLEIKLADFEALACSEGQCHEAKPTRRD
jgi:hypothetical protein